MTDQIQTQQSSGESKLPWFYSLGNPWSVSIPTGPGQDPMIDGCLRESEGSCAKSRREFEPPVVRMHAGLTGVLTLETGWGEQGTYLVHKTEGVPQNPVTKILF